MSGNSGNDINYSETRANGVTFQASVYGASIPILYGRVRVPGNMLWYGDFKAIPHTTSQTSGGKGGGGATITNTTYTYTASFLFGLGEGPIHSIAGLWHGKDYKADPANLFQHYTPSKAIGERRYVSSSRTCTVAHADRWTGSVGCWRIYDTYSTDENGYQYVSGTVSVPLTMTDGIPTANQFAVSNGVYTFGPNISNTWVSITYYYNAVNNTPALISQFTGTYPQTPWSYLTSKHPLQALGYQGIAYAAAMAWNLGASTGLPNLNFDVIAGLPFSLENEIFDANPKEILVDLLTNPHYGLGFPSENIGDLTQFNDYCVANGLFLSPAYSAQEEASAILTQLMRLTNSGIYFSEGQLKITPFGDVETTGNQVTYTPNITPAYELTEDDFIVDGDEDPVQIARVPAMDMYNHVQVEFLNAENQFNTEVAEAKDQVAIDVFGLRTLSPIKAHEIKSPRVAKAVAQNILQESVYICNTYTFRLGWKHCRLEPTDLVTLTDPGAGLDKTPVRILSIEEDQEGVLSIQAEDAPPGVSSHALYPHQEVGGYTSEYNRPSGAINTPVLFEAPWVLTANGHEIWVATSGGEHYGGCSVWLSSDGTNYKKVGDMTGPARHGFLTDPMEAGTDPDTINTCKVDLSESSGVLTSGSIADADNKATLAWVGGEFMAYSTATLTGQYTYTLGGYMRRGLHDTKITGHSAQSQFVRCDGALFRFSYDPDLVGKTVFLKFPAFNPFGGGGQSLADAAEYPFEILGELPAPKNFRVSAGSNGSRIFTWEADRMPSYFSGYRILYASGSVPDISKMAPLADGFVTSPFQHNGLSAGDYTFAVVAVNSVGRQSPPAFLEAYVADPSIPAAWMDQTVYWSGTWGDLPRRWRDLGPTWRILAPLAAAGSEYISETIDLGSNRWTEPMVSATFMGGVGSATFKMKSGTDADGGVVGSWQNLKFVGARYIQIQASNVTGPLISIRIRATASTVDICYNDIATATAQEGPTWHRISAGHFSIGTSSDTDAILVARIDAIQGIGAGATWELVSKSDSIGGNPAATFKIYNSALALVDAEIDVTLKVVQKVV